MPATTGIATPRTSASAPSWASVPTASRSSGAGSSPKKASSRVPRSTTTGACAPRCLEHGLEPIVTFHHFTTPRWVAARGGWVEPTTSDRFARFCERAAAHLGDVIARACTLNEPNIVATMRPPATASSRPGSATPIFAGGPTTSSSPRTTRPSRRSAPAPGTSTVGLTLADVRLPGRRRRRRRARPLPPRSWRTFSWRPHAATTSSACSRYSRHPLRARGHPAVPIGTFASRRWATSSGPRRSRRPSVARGR